MTLRINHGKLADGEDYYIASIGSFRAIIDQWAKTINNGDLEPIDRGYRHTMRMIEAKSTTQAMERFFEIGNEIFPKKDGWSDVTISVQKIEVFCSHCDLGDEK